MDAEETLLEAADLLLVLSDGQELPTCRAFLALASPLLRDVLRCGLKRGREGGRASDAAALPCLQVDGSYEGWKALLRFLAEPSLSGRPAQLTPSSAFLILPIAHTYNMAALLHSCIDVAQRSLPALQTPEAVPPGISSMAGAVSTASTPVPSSASTSTSTPASSATVATRTFTACTAGQSSEPSLFDWLALADAKQLTPLVNSCMSHLAGAAEAGAVVRSALAWPQSRSCLERLCSETMMELLNVTTGLPANFRGVRLPDLSAAPAFEFKAGPGSDAMPYHGFCGCLGGPDAGYLVHPIYRSQSVCVTHLATGGSFHLHGDPPEVNVVVANERSVLSSSMDGPLVLWPSVWTGGGGGGPERQRRSHTFPGNSSVVLSLCFVGPLGAQAHAASGHEGRSRPRCASVRLWDLEASVATSRFDGHSGDVVALAAAQDGRPLVVSAALDNTARLWDARVPSAGAGARVLSLQGHERSLWSAAMDAGTTAVTGSQDGTIKLWDLGSGRAISSFTACNREGHQQGLAARGPAGVVRLYLDAQRSVVLSCCHHEAHVWDVSRGCLLASHALGAQHTPLSELCASRDLSTVVAAVQHGVLHDGTDVAMEEQAGHGQQGPTQPHVVFKVWRR